MRGRRCGPCSSATSGRLRASSRARRSCARWSRRGRDPRATLLREIAEEPLFTIDSDAELDEAFRELEERDFERVPVVEDGSLVGVLSRAVVQRRLAEDEPPAEEAD